MFIKKYFLRSFLVITLSTFILLFLPFYSSNSLTTHAFSIFDFFKNDNTQVLGKKDEEDEDKDDDKDKDEGKDEDKEKEDDNDKKKEDKDEDEEDDKDEDKNEDKEKEDDNDKEKEEMDKEEKDDNEKKENVEIEQTIKNSDGTYTKIKKEIKKDGGVKLEVKQYDKNGNKILVKNFEREDDKTEAEIKKYDSFENKLSNVELKTEDGKRLMLKVKEGSQTRKFKYDPANQVLKMKLGDDSDGDSEQIGKETDTYSNDLEDLLEIKAEGNGFTLSKKGVKALVNFPIIVDDEKGSVFVSTPLGDLPIKTTPDNVADKVSKTLENFELEDINIDVLSSSDSNLTSKSQDASVVYKVEGTKKERLLGLVPVNLDTSLVFDAQTGELVNEVQNLMTNIMDFFSF